MASLRSDQPAYLLPGQDEPLTIDLDQLRLKIAEKAEPGTIVTVSRRFLEQVERELTEGRVAIAQLQRQVCMAEVISGLGRPAGS